MVKALDLKSNGISRAGSNPAAVVCFATIRKELSFAFDFFDKKSASDHFLCFKIELTLHVYQ